MMKFEVKIPQVGESITEVEIAQWLKKDGDAVDANDLICEIESDKASFEIPAENPGILKILAPEGETVPIGGCIAEIMSESTSNAISSSETKSDETLKQDARPPAGGTALRPNISPLAANILREVGIPANQLQGSGTGGKIIKDDVLKAIQSSQSPSASDSTVSPAPARPAVQTPFPQKETPAADIPSGEPSIHRKRMSSLRRTIAKRLVSAKNDTAMLTTFNEVDLSAVKQLRQKYKELFKEKHEIGLGFMSFFTRAVCLALKEWPALNAMIDGDEILYYDDCDISIAVSSPRGLVVPVIRNADKLSLAEIEKMVLELAQKARNNQLTIEEMSGGNFTISNGGVFGSLLSTPILNAPQSAILGMHKIEDRPIVVKGEIVIRPMMYLALSYDHRIIDGRESVSFLVRVKEYLEDPGRMLLGV